jgi:hypothetical protein
MGACGNQKAKGPITANRIPGGDSKPHTENPETNPNEPETIKKSVINETPTGREIKIKIHRDGESEPEAETFDAGLTLLRALQKGVVKKLPRHAEFTVLGPNGQDITAMKDKKLGEIVGSGDSYSLTIKYLGLEISKDPKKAYAETNLIGAPKFDSEPFEVVTFDKRTNQLKPLQIRQADLVRDFGYFSSFCNGKNTLYLSGGERERKTEKGTETELMSNFVSIDLTNGNVKVLKNLFKARSMHSTIYVPDKWVFIVGGTDTKSVDLLDISNNTLTQDSMLNEERSEPSLCLVRDDQYAYLYAFCGFKYKMAQNTTIERCNLQVKTRTWEIVSYKTSGVPLNICFFATAMFRDDKLLLLGGSESSKSSNEKNYNYNWRNDTADVSTNVQPVFEVFNEKFFIPLGDNWSALIPMPSCDQAKVLILRDNGKIETISYQDPADENPRSSFKA